MNPKSFVKLSNIVGTISIVLLIYWVFVFISIEVFGLKVFRENMTETFYMSVLGILALMSGALFINVMFNLTRIAEKHNQDNSPITKTYSDKIKWIFILSFPIIFALLFGGDYLTSQKKEKLLLESAKAIIENNSVKAERLLNYSFNEKWLIEISDILYLMSKTDKNFPNVSVIVNDSIDNSEVLLSFDYYNGQLNDTIQPKKKAFMRATTKQERDYLHRVFYENFNEIRFDAHDGNYELFYPYFKNDKKIVLYFSDFQKYGKIGS
jgi:hypothetical protein